MPAAECNIAASVSAEYRPRPGRFIGVSPTWWHRAKQKSDRGPRGFRNAALGRSTGREIATMSESATYLVDGKELLADQCRTLFAGMALLDRHTKVLDRIEGHTVIDIGCY